MNRKGFTLIELVIVIAIISIILSVAVPSLINARRDANQRSAIVSLRTLFNSQALFLLRDEDTDGISDYATSLSELHSTDLIDNVLGCGTKSGYIFRLQTPAGESPLGSWECTANPMVPRVTGIRYFFINQNGMIRFSIAQEATRFDSGLD